MAAEAPAALKEFPEFPGEPMSKRCGATSTSRDAWMDGWMDGTDDATPCDDGTRRDDDVTDRRAMRTMR